MTRRTQILIVLAAALLPRLPFLWGAFQGDDIYYLAGAQHAQIDPLHPHHARYVYHGVEVSMRGHPHPPLNAAWLGAVLAFAGDTREVIFHLAYLPFSAMAAVAMLALARRFSPHPVLATLVFLAAPALLVNANSVEADVPFTALWLAGIACFVRGWLGCAAVALSLAGLMAYQAVAAIPILWCYLRWGLDRPARRVEWLAALAPGAALAAWQAFEWVTSGGLPVAATASYFSEYGLQRLEAKLRNAAGLTVHLGVLGFLAIRWRPAPIAVALAAGAGAMFIDAHPLFVAPFALGAAVIASLDWRRWEGQWLLIFFGAAVAVFFAGAARYLLPLAPAAAIAASRLRTPRTLAFGAGLLASLGLCLAWSNAEQWNGYRTFIGTLRDQFPARRVWVNGEWGLRFYAESEGAMPLVRGQAIRPGDLVITGELGYPLPLTTGGGALAPVAATGIQTTLPIRPIALGGHSGWSSVAMGLRAFDLALRSSEHGIAPVDRVRAEQVIAREPGLSWVPMNHPEADLHLVSGFYSLEGTSRWIAPRALVLLKSPPGPTPIAVTVYLPPNAAARRITLALDGVALLDQPLAPGLQTVTSPPVAPTGRSAMLTITVDKPTRVAGDGRELGAIVTGAGFGPR
ncbi:MAG: hypothetical protein FJW40_04925 [Acidobacteria bacterium]|nr:hypothetical protein [Acidobacteriota bacterium]